MSLILIAWVLNLVSTWFMVGLIWFVQVVHYPLHGVVPESVYQEYQQKHMTWTTFVVAAPMLIEAGTAGYLVYRPPGFAPPIWWYVGFGLVVVNVLSTYFLQRPAHEKLLESYTARTQEFLVRSNWIRTAAWSLRGLLWIYLLLLLARS